MLRICTAQAHAVKDVKCIYIMQKMERYTAEMAAHSSEAGGEGAAPAEASEKPRAAYGEWRPTMVKIMTAILTDQMKQGETKKFLKRARNTFKEVVGEEAKYLDLGYLARDTLRRMREEGDVRDQPAPGATPKLTPEKRAEALDLLLKGNGKSGVDFIGYASLQAALEECKALRKIAEDAGITTRTLRRNLQDEHRERYGKKLKKISIHFKPKLAPDVKQERLEAAEKWAQWRRRQFYRIVWIDEKQEYLKRGGLYHCYAPPGMTSFIRETDAPLGKCPKLKYEAAVAGFCGALYFRAITGTTKLKRGYRVRTVPSSAHFDPASLRSRGPCFVQDLHFLSPVRLCNAQHAVALRCCPLADSLVRCALRLVELVLADEVL